MPETLEDPILIEENLVYEIIPQYQHYGTINEADKYFGVMLHGELWSRQNNTTKYKALVTATNIIDKLRFSGTKTDSTQSLEFPRYGDTSVPVAIQRACFEIALALLKGVNPSTEYDNLFIKSRTFGRIDTTYNDASPEYKRAGVPSLTAWQLLLPYIKPSVDLRLRRDC